MNCESGKVKANFYPEESSHARLLLLDLPSLVVSDGKIVGSRSWRTYLSHELEPNIPLDTHCYHWWEGREGLIVHQTKYTSLLKIPLALADLFSDQTVFRNSNAMNAKLHLTISDKFCFAFLS